MKMSVAVINDPNLDSDSRLDALRSLEAGQRKPAATNCNSTGEINNHIHTIYSFSPYTPAMAALNARNAGLCAAGSVDHDSIAAANEMIAACAILGIGGCAGFEMRVSFKGPFARRKLNNPDSEGYAYMTVQGIPRQSIPKAAEFLVPVRERRLRRTGAMCVAANDLLRDAGLEEIDFERDIVAASKFAEGGGITERHLLAAVAEKLIAKYGRGPEIAGGLGKTLGIRPTPKIAALLADPSNPHYLYDLLGVLKAEFLPRVYIQPDEDECIPAETVTAFAESIGAISAYAYLGDVGESPTGDKKAEKFEDDYIEELFEELSRLGYRAVTYMPPRNTMEQLRRVQRLCAQWGFMEICGVDINSSRQSFNCPETLRPEFRHLLDTTWALIAHERLSSADERFGLFSPNNPLAGENLSSRIAAYAAAGKKLDLLHQESASAMALLGNFSGGTV
jgi:hypothetical protein